MKGQSSRPRQWQSERLGGNECEMNVTFKSKAAKINERGGWKSPGLRVRKTQSEQRMDGWMDGWRDGGKSNY